MSDPKEFLDGLFLTNEGNTFMIAPAKIVDVCRKLRQSGYEHLSCITAVDWKKNWEIVYHIAKYGTRELVVVKVTLAYREPRIASVTGVWPGAGWHEREAYDLMGIEFIGSPDQRRILLPQEYEGHPLRKEVKYGNTS